MFVRVFDTGLVAGLLLTFFQTGSAFSLGDLPKALERVASYGYSMLGYESQSHGSHSHGSHGYGYGSHYGEDDLEIYQVDGPLWDGHISVGDFISPVVAAISDSGIGGGGGYGDDGRVVKGYDGRLGMRVALPYLGDFQVTREFGPGRYGQDLGPGKYPYPGYKTSSGVASGYGGGSAGYAAPVATYVLTESKKKKKKKPLSLKHLYKGLSNYPWHKR